MVTDVEHHLVPPSLLEAVSKAPKGTPGSRVARTRDIFGDAITELDLGPRLDAMDGCGIDLTLLSLPGLDTYDLDRREGTADLIRRCNDELIGAAENHPGRFAVLIALPFPFEDDCLAELNRLAGHPLVRGVIAFATTGEWTLDDARLEPVFSTLGRLGLPVLLHPSMGEIQEFPALQDWRLSASLGAVFETSIIASRLVFSGLLDRVPELTLIVPHLGGVLPYLAQRIGDLTGNGDAQHDLLYYLQNHILFDSCSYYPPALSLAVETVTADRILLGSDFPARGPISRAVEDIRNGGLTESQQEAILRNNAIRFGLTTESNGVLS